MHPRFTQLDNESNEDGYLWGEEVRSLLPLTKAGDRHLHRTGSMSGELIASCLNFTSGKRTLQCLRVLPVAETCLTLFLFPWWIVELDSVN